MKKIRSAMCTIHFKNDAYEAVPDWNSLGFVKRAMGQLEKGEQGKLHWQIFIECKYPIDPKRLMGLGMHVDYKSTHKHPKAGRAYVRKPTHDIKSRFDWPEDTEVFTAAKQRKTDEAEALNNWNHYKIYGDKKSIMNLLRANIKKCSQINGGETGA